MKIDEFHAQFKRQEPRDELTERVIGAAIEVHRVLGPGLTEIMYEEALCHEFDQCGIAYERQVPIDVLYKGKVIGQTRLDLIVEKRLIVELKACDDLNDVHKAQCICYLRVTRLELALLINFNVAVLKEGLKRVVLTRRR